MTQNTTAALDLITSWWKSGIIHTGVLMNVFDSLQNGEARKSDEIAIETDADPELCYRLLRAIASIGALSEAPGRLFTITEMGSLFCSNHPTSLRAVTLLEAGNELPAVWAHLPNVIRSGNGTGAEREFGQPWWDVLRDNQELSNRLDDAMSSYSQQDALSIKKALVGEDFGKAVVCDIGGGHGTLLAAMLDGNHEATGIVLEVPHVVRRAHQLGLDSKNPRIHFLAGDMFEDVPTADIYLMKHILHDWSDSDCVRILRAAASSTNSFSKLLIFEWLIPEPEVAHFSKIVDIHMMSVNGGKERTREEYAAILQRSGWIAGRCISIPGSPMSVLEATKMEA